MRTGWMAQAGWTQGEQPTGSRRTHRRLRYLIEVYPIRYQQRAVSLRPWKKLGQRPRRHQSQRDLLPPVLVAQEPSSPSWPCLGWLLAADRSPPHLHRIPRNGCFACRYPRNRWYCRQSLHRHRRHLHCILRNFHCRSLRICRGSRRGRRQSPCRPRYHRTCSGWLEPSFSLHG